MNRVFFVSLLQIVLVILSLQFSYSLTIQAQPYAASVTDMRTVGNTIINLHMVERLNFPQSAKRLIASSQVYFPVILQNEMVCGQFVWFRQGIDRYPGFQLHNSSELWFFDEFSLGTMPAEGSYGTITNPQFMNEDFAPGIRWLMGASAITVVSSC